VTVQCLNLGWVRHNESNLTLSNNIVSARNEPESIIDYKRDRNDYSKNFLI
jgi:hypothetical protein